MNIVLNIIFGIIIFVVIVNILYKLSNLSIKISSLITSIVFTFFGLNGTIVDDKFLYVVVINFIISYICSFIGFKISEPFNDGDKYIYGIVWSISYALPYVLIMFILNFIVA